MTDIYMKHLRQHMLRVKKKINEIYRDDLKAMRMFEACFMNTIETTVTSLEDQSLFVITGDIPAMWLRDSAAQVHHYLAFAKEDPVVYELIDKVVEKQFFYINLDPYANAFNAEANGNHYAKDESGQNDWEWERKYEVDSLCFPVNLAFELYQKTGKTKHLTTSVYNGFKKIIDLWKTEQMHREKSDYRFERPTEKETETLADDGQGKPVAYTGMTWSGFRPSDDACTYGYPVPANMFASVVLGQIQVLARQVYKDLNLAEDAERLRIEIENGINRYGVIDHPIHGKVYAYEVDGLGNYLLMDDANIPSLLSIPYLGFCGSEDSIYQNTRRMLLSKSNPYYFSGKGLKGIGSPHSKPNRVWPLSIIIEAMTQSDYEFKLEKLRMLMDNEAGTFYMHESIDVDDDTIYTRDWFAWANSMFSELLMQIVGVQ